MKENINMLKEWYKLAKPNKSYFIFQFVTVIIQSITIVCEAMYVAKVTTYITSGNYVNAVISLAVALAFIWLHHLANHLNYENDYYLVGDSYKKLQEKIYHKIINSKEKNFKKNNQEKLLHIIHDDAYQVAEFSDLLCDKCCFLFSTILAVGYIFGNSVIIGLVVTAIIITNYIILNHLNNNISKATKICKDAEDDELEISNEIINSKDIIKNYILEEKISKKYAKASEKYLMKKHNEKVATSYVDNIFVGYYNTLIFFITLVLIYLLSHNNLELTTYFVIVSYLTESIVNSNDFMGVLTDLKNTYVSVNRVNIILNFDEMKVLSCGNVEHDKIKGEIDFINVNYEGSNCDNIKTVDIHNINIHIPSTKTVLFHGNRGCGKRTIFHLLNRDIKQTSGDIYVDKIKLRNYNRKTYLKNINYITTAPYFYSGSILSNLKLVCNDKDAIIEVLEKVGLADYKLNTDVGILTRKEQYLLGIARLLLLNSEIIVFYEFPSYLSDKDKKEIMKVIKSLHNKKTILIFSAGYDVKDIADQIIEIENGKISRKKRKNLV